jgi:hypothetical protein
MLPDRLPPLSGDRPTAAPDAHWIHVGSLNGTEVAHKVNREVAVQVESAALHAYLATVFTWDWATTNALFLPWSTCAPTRNP